MEKLLHSLAPAQCGVGHQRLHVLDDFGLLQVKGLDDQIFLRGEKRVEERPRDPNFFIYLFHRRVLDALLCHQLKPDCNKLRSDALSVLLRICYLRHAVTPLS